jgi:hypothetical protein
MSQHTAMRHGSELLLVTGGRQHAGTSGRSNAPSTEIFKVHLDRSGAGIKVECLWTAFDVGPFLPDIAEDFNGDEYRDLVFSGVGYDYTPTVILSGKDGHRLLGFQGTELDVEKGVTGPKRVGVLERYDGGRRLPKHEPGTSTNVFEFSRDKGMFEAVNETATVSAEAVKASGGRLEAREDAVRRTFAAEVGGVEHVRAYVLQRGDPTRFQVEEVQVRLPRLSRPTPELVKAGYPGRILFEYKSPSFLARERKQESGQEPK